jgi:small GTP-binding protein
VVLTKDGSVYIKIVYWGMVGSGKTTILETLYKITKESKKDIEPVEDLKKIEKASGATLHFDRGLFQSTKQKKIFYRVFTVAGQSSFSPLRSKIFQGTDAVIVVVDSQTKYLEDNVESLLELKNVAQDRLIKEIPVIVMLNKQDLEDTINIKDYELILEKEKLWHDSKHELHNWNPMIYGTCALYGKEKNVYRSFYECARRAFDNTNFPYPFIFKPPKPPDDLALALQTQKKSVVDDILLWEGLYCIYCGNPISEGQDVCSNCGNKVQ